MTEQESKQKYEQACQELRSAAMHFDSKMEDWRRQKVTHLFNNMENLPLFWPARLHKGFTELSLQDYFVFSCILGYCCITGSRDTDCLLYIPILSQEQLKHSLKHLIKHKLISVSRDMNDDVPFGMPFEIHLRMELDDFKKMLELFDNPHHACSEFEEIRADGEITECFTKSVNTEND